MTNIINLPLDVWYIIVEHLPLKTLASMYEAFYSFSCISSIAKRKAVKVIATRLTTGTPAIIPGFTFNGLCHRFSFKHPRAGWRLQKEDHGSKLPCTGIFAPYLGVKYSHSRSFHQNDIDDTNTEMALFTRNIPNKPILLPPQLGGPTEFSEVIIIFPPDPAQTNEEDYLLCIKYRTPSENIENTYIDTSHGQFRIERTISHHVSLESIRWGNRKAKFHPLPIEWFVFADSNIAASSTFSKVLLDPHSEDGRWEMLSFSAKWNLELCHERGPQGNLN